MYRRWCCSEGCRRACLREGGDVYGRDFLFLAWTRNELSWKSCRCVWEVVGEEMVCVRDCVD